MFACHAAVAKQLVQRCTDAEDKALACLELAQLAWLNPDMRDLGSVYIRCKVSAILTIRFVTM